MAIDIADLPLMMSDWPLPDGYRLYDGGKFVILCHPVGRQLKTLGIMKTHWKKESMSQFIDQLNSQSKPLSF